MSAIGGLGGGGGYASKGGTKGLSMPLLETVRMAWADPELRSRIIFVFWMFAVFALGVQIQVPIPGVRAEAIAENLANNPLLGFIDMFGGGALRKISIFSLGLNPYITASIIMQVLTTAFPAWKKELQEGGEYARKQQNRRTRFLCVLLCIVQGSGLLVMMSSAQYGQVIPPETGWVARATVVMFWTAGAMFMLWLGEQISEKGIGNGVSLMIFAGIVLSMPYQIKQISEGISAGAISIFSVIGVVLIFVAVTWLIVLFTTAQRRIPIQHMRRMAGTKMQGGQTSYLPLSVNMAGVIPIIFAISLLYIPNQIALVFGGENTPIGRFFTDFGTYLQPNAHQVLFTIPGLDWDIHRGLIGSISFTALIFFFTYFWTAVQYNVEDISDNLKRGGSFIPGVRPGKQTRDFLDGVISRITVVGALFISFVALVQYWAPGITGISFQYVGMIGGTSLLIMVSVALETMRQIEANLLMKQYRQ